MKTTEHSFHTALEVAILNEPSHTDGRAIVGTLVSHPTEPVDQLSVIALKSLVSDYAIRAKQAEEMCNLLLNEKISQVDLIQAATNLLSLHSQHRVQERVVHQQAVLQSVHFTLETIKYLKSEEEIRATVNRVLKQITLSLGHMYTPEEENT